MKKLMSAIPVLIALAVSLPVNASTTPITGATSVAENACICFVQLFVGKATSYNEASYFGGPADGSPRNLWAGPIYTGGFYAKGAGPGAANPGGVTPGGKQAAALKGHISITGSGPGAVIGGRVDIGPATFAIVGQGTDAGEATWNRLRYEIADKMADSATPNLLGGFTYVIGTQGVPDLLVDLTGTDTFPSEVGGNLTFGPLIPFWTPPGAPGLNDTAGISNFDPNVSGLPNVGTTANGSFQKLSCTDIVGDGACDGGSAINNAPDIDNLIMVVETNECGRVLSGFAYATRESTVESPFGQLNSWNATTWVFQNRDDEDEGGACFD